MVKAIIHEKITMMAQIISDVPRGSSTVSNNGRNGRWAHSNKTGCIRPQTDNAGLERRLQHS